jgi:dihydroorotase
MPNTVPPTVTIAALADKVRRAADTDGCDLRFFFGVTEAAHLLALRELWTGTSLELKRLKKHCCGVKLYLDHSTGNQKVQADIIGDIFRTCAELKIPIIAHCEDPDMNAQALAKNTRTDIAAHSEIRSPESEAASIKAAIEHMRTSGAALHIAHLSTAQGLELVRAAKKEKLPVTCEVAPHHLFLTVDDYSWLGTLGKMNPPLRTMEHRDALWAGIADKTVDCIATDHAPHTLAEKRTDEPLTAPSGVPGVETMLPLLLTVAAGKWPAKSKKPAGATLAYTDIIRLCFMRPNEIFSLHAADIKVKGPARMIIVNPSQEWTLKNSDLKTKCGWSPFDGWTVQGCVDRIVQ